MGDMRIARALAEFPRRQPDNRATIDAASYQEPKKGDIVS